MAKKAPVTKQDVAAATQAVKKQMNKPQKGSITVGEIHAEQGEEKKTCYAYNVVKNEGEHSLVKSTRVLWVKKGATPPPKKIIVLIQEG